MKQSLLALAAASFLLLAGCNSGTTDRDTSRNPPIVTAPSKDTALPTDEGKTFKDILAKNGWRITSANGPTHATAPVSGCLVTLTLVTLSPLKYVVDSIGGQTLEKLGEHVQTELGEPNLSNNTFAARLKQLEKEDHFEPC